MLTVEKLKEFGVDTDEGLNRCMNMEAFYFKMIKMGLANEYFDKLEVELKNADIAAAFESAHALKGVVGNLAISPIYKPLSDITEKLRAKESADYVALYAPVKELRDKLLALCD